MSAQQLLIMTLMAVFVQAFFAMMEMALVSFNKVRLQYYLGQESKKAKLIFYLLTHPGILFGTTLIGINFSLQFGSECSRRFYMALGLNPDFAPLTQVLIVVIFAELVPLIAARRYAEHVALLGIRVLYCFSWLFRPFVFLLDLMIQFVFKLFGVKKESLNLLTKEEIQKAIETREDKQGFLKEEEFDQIMANLFSLKNKTAADLMFSVQHYISLPVTATVQDIKDQLQGRLANFVLVYEETTDHIIGFISVREAIFSSKETPIKQLLKSPWFVPKNFNLYQLIEHFKKSDKQIAFVIDDLGKTTGVMTLSRIMDAVFEVQEVGMGHKEFEPNVHINRSFIGDTQISVINKTYHLLIPTSKEDETLDELMQTILGHHSTIGESIRIGDFELIVEDAPLIGDKVILVKSL